MDNEEEKAFIDDVIKESIQHLQTMFRQEFVKSDIDTRHEFILFMFTVTHDLNRWHSMEPPPLDS